MTIALFDPSIASENLGDQIILESVALEFAMLLPDEQIVRVPTQDVIGRRTRRIACEASHRIVGGTNLLSSHMRSYRQWEIGLIQAVRLPPVILMGVGWWQYQDAPDVYTRQILRRILARQGVHSVRDSYTAAKLAGIGIRNVVNTCCPTTWRLTPDHCATIPHKRAQAVVMTLTDYHPSGQADTALIDMLAKLYDRVFFWPQGTGDMRYMATLGRIEKLTVLRPSLEALDEVLSGPVDFVGTRLHAGIRALQKRSRSCVLAVDNRAQEISRDIGLRVIPRDDLASLSNWIEMPAPTVLHLPFNDIERWRQQFMQPA